MITMKQEFTDQQKLIMVKKYLELSKQDPDIFTKEELLEELTLLVNSPTDYFKPF